MESSTIKLKDYINNCLSLGFFRFLCTDIDKDGKLGGAGVNLYKKLLNHSPFIKLIASGGISSMADIEALQKIKVESPNDKNLGDIIISLEQVQNDAETKWNRSFEHHLIALLAHGLAHLIGHDHHTNEEYKEMLKLEKRLLKSVDLGY